MTTNARIKALCEKKGVIFKPWEIPPGKSRTTSRVLTLRALPLRFGGRA